MKARKQDRNRRQPQAPEPAGGRLDETRTWVLKEGLESLRKGKKKTRPSERPQS